jgi:hypothetical protein
LFHCKLAWESGLGPVFGGGDWLHPVTASNNIPDTAAPAFSDFHMATPLLVI